MGNPIICYENHVPDAAVITASNEEPGFEAVNCTNWLLYDWWNPSQLALGLSQEYITFDFGAGVDVDAAAIAGHNAAAIEYSNIQIRWSTDNFGASDNLAGQWLGPGTSNVPAVMTFNQITARYWRIVINHGAAVGLGFKLAALFIGKHLELLEPAAVGFAPPTLSYNDRVLNQRSEGGYLLGRSVKSLGTKGTLRITDENPVFIRQSWQPFMAHARLLPFWLSWDNDNFPNEAAYCWTDGPLNRANYTTTLYMSTQLDFVGITG